MTKKLSGKQHIVIPFSYAKEKIRETKNDKIKIVVPGTVSNKRRIYYHVVKAFQPYLDDIDLVFLGKNQLGYRFKGIKTFNDYIPTHQYNSELATADILLFPHRRCTNTVNAHIEIYGLTKAFNIHEAIKYRKPFIVPHYSHIPENLREIAYRYKNIYDLEAFIRKILYDNDFLKKLKEKAFDATKTYTLKHIRKHVYKELGI